MEQKFPKSEGVWMKSQIQILNSQKTKNKKTHQPQKGWKKVKSLPLILFHLRTITSF